MHIGLPSGEKNVQKYSPTQVARDLQKTRDFLRSHRFDYMLIGGLALSIWGRPRLTLDLDFLVLVDEKNIENLANLAKNQKMKVDRNWGKWNPMLKGSQLRLYVGITPVDLMLPRDDHDRTAFRRKKRKMLGKQMYYIIAPDDFVLQKLKVGRPRDFEDAATVLDRFRGKLNMVYMRKWARRLGILEELTYVVNV